MRRFSTYDPHNAHDTYHSDDANQYVSTRLDLSRHASLLGLGLRPKSMAQPIHAFFEAVLPKYLMLNRNIIRFIIIRSQRIIGLLCSGSNM